MPVKTSEKLAEDEKFAKNPNTITHTTPLKRHLIFLVSGTTNTSSTLHSFSIQNKPNEKIIKTAVPVILEMPPRLNKVSINLLSETK